MLLEECSHNLSEIGCEVIEFSDCSKAQIFYIGIKEELAK